MRLLLRATVKVCLFDPPHFPSLMFQRMRVMVRAKVRIRWTQGPEVLRLAQPARSLDEESTHACQP